MLSRSTKNISSRFPLRKKVLNFVMIRLSVLRDAVDLLRYKCDCSQLRKLLAIRRQFPTEWEILHRQLFVPSMSSKIRADLNMPTIRFVCQMFPNMMSTKAIPEFFALITSWLHDTDDLPASEMSELYSIFRAFMGSGKNSYKETFGTYLSRWETLTADEKNILTQVKPKIDLKTRKRYFFFGQENSQNASGRQSQFEKVSLRLDNFKSNQKKIQTPSVKKSHQPATVITDQTDASAEEETSDEENSETVTETRDQKSITRRTEPVNQSESVRTSHIQTWFVLHIYLRYHID